ncbi:MAG: AMP-binding protein [Verrucomicrobiota bacterium]
MLVQDLLQRSAAMRPDHVALVGGSRRVTYAEFEAQSNRLAHGLRKLGVARGDRVGIHLKNSIETAVTMFAVLKAGAVFVSVNRTTKPEKLAAILNDCEACALVTDARAAEQGGALATAAPNLRHLVVCGPQGTAAANGQHARHNLASILSENPADPPAAGGIDLDLACLIYTSGTTGESKGVMCDHSNVVFVTEAIVSYLRNSSSDIVLSVLPMSFSYGLYQLMASVCAGGTLIIEDSFVFPDVILQKLADERVTGFAGVPTIYSILLGLDLSKYDLSALRYLTNAAAGLPVEHVKRLRQLFPRTDLYLMHGLTEVARTMYLPPDQADLRPGSSGIAMPGTELWIEDDEGRRLGPNEVGELVVRGRHVMRGYWKAPELSAQRFRPGPIPGERLCYSGDLFRTDAEGYFYFVSRKDDIIKSRGEKIAPREVENVLYTIRGVQDAAVIGVPDPMLGQAVKAFLVAPEAALTEAEVIAHCKRHLEEFMVPRSVEFRSELPKTGSGKIRKIDLR